MRGAVINVSLCSQDGETPLIKATKMRNIEIVELLLDKGAKVSAVDKVRASLTCSSRAMGVCVSLILIAPINGYLKC